MATNILHSLWAVAMSVYVSRFVSRLSTILMLSAVGRFSGIVPTSSRMVFRRRKAEGLRAIDATTFRVGDLFAWHLRVEPSRDRSATVQPWAGLKNPFRIPLTGFKCGINRRLIRRTGA